MLDTSCLVTTCCKTTIQLFTAAVVVRKLITDTAFDFSRWSNHQTGWERVTLFISDDNEARLSAMSTTSPPSPQQHDACTLTGYGGRPRWRHRSAAVVRVGDTCWRRGLHQTEWGGWVDRVEAACWARNRTCDVTMRNDNKHLVCLRCNNAKWQWAPCSLVSSGPWRTPASDVAIIPPERTTKSNLSKIAWSLEQNHAGHGVGGGVSN